MTAIQEALLNPDIKDPLKLPRTILQGFSDKYKQVKGESNWTGSLRKPEGYTPPNAVTTVDGSASNLVSPKELGVTPPGSPTTIAGLATPKKDAPKTDAPGETTTGQSATTPTNPSANADTASTSGTATNSQADALSNNVNEGENKAKQTMTVQSGSDMGGVNYTNAGGKSTTATTSFDDVMPQESATPTNQKYNSWMQNASTFGTSDENEKQPLTLTKTVYWKSRRKK